MSTWDDKPNYYEHLLAEISRLREENTMLKEQIKDLSDQLAIGGENMAHEGP